MAVSLQTSLCMMLYARYQFSKSQVSNFLPIFRVKFAAGRYNRVVWVMRSYLRDLLRHTSSEGAAMQKLILKHNLNTSESSNVIDASQMRLSDTGVQVFIDMMLFH